MARLAINICDATENAAATGAGAKAAVPTISVKI